MSTVQGDDDTTGTINTLPDTTTTTDTPARESTGEEADSFYDSFATGPTETPGRDNARAEAKAEPEPEHISLTKAEWEAIKAEQEQLRQSHESGQNKVFGTIGGIQRQLKDLASGKLDIPDEEIEEMEMDFPAIGKLMRQVKSLKAIPVAGADPEVVERTVRHAVEVSTRPLHQQLVAVQHPDWEQVTASPEFVAYAQALPPQEQQVLAQTWDSGVISGHLSRFKATLKPKPAPTPAPADTSAQRRSRMQAAAIPQGRGAPAGASEKDAFHQAFNE
jgi:hypothetical protein